MISFHFNHLTHLIESYMFVRFMLRSLGLVLYHAFMHASLLHFIQHTRFCFTVYLVLQDIGVKIKSLKI